MFDFDTNCFFAALVILVPYLIYQFASGRGNLRQ